MAKRLYKNKNQTNELIKFAKLKLSMKIEISSNSIENSIEDATSQYAKKETNFASLKKLMTML